MKRKFKKKKPVESPHKKKKYQEFATKCRFCRSKVESVDYKDMHFLQKLVGSQGKLLAKKRSGNCTKHQCSVKIALKRARHMALLT
jgi:small subunit ribosomal protein S18